MNQGIERFVCQIDFEGGRFFERKTNRCIFLVEGSSFNLNIIDVILSELSSFRLALGSSLPNKSIAVIEGIIVGAAENGNLLLNCSNFYTFTLIKGGLVSEESEIKDR